MHWCRRRTAALAVATESSRGYDRFGGWLRYHNERIQIDCKLHLSGIKSDFIIARSRPFGPSPSARASPRLFSTAFFHNGGVIRGAGQELDMDTGLRASIVDTGGGGGGGGGAADCW
ncbi:hypothetical protein DAEQUDRAFT_307630 [Daedalea quercina L-15889]|uniref:Uncharacterized protein n=1 Tax=Daedalea quercina L-15889 TaxID=1314783 RepID=A0A165Q343_9APHY|nr:hypothetical protein DAEQUDRAFT_307630 [Daedalea quercina L-15889]